MSTTILPDIYRHFARKSTVSRNVKIPVRNASLSNSNFSVDNNSKEDKSSLNKDQSDSELDKNIQQQKQIFHILTENETEEMIVEQTNDEIIRDILEQIQQQISDEFSDEKTISNKIRTVSIDAQSVTNSILNRLEINDHEFLLTIDNPQMNTTDRSLNEYNTSMEHDQQSSILSQSQTEDDTAEMEKSTSNIHPLSCTCQCHQMTSDSAIGDSTNDYFEFEQALQQVRQAAEREESLKKNSLVLTLKHQHQELLNFYQKQLNINKIDREQQTVSINHHDSQMQTDMIINQPQNPKTIVSITTNEIIPTIPARIIPAATIRPFASFITPIRTTGPSLQQLIPCLTTTSGTGTGIALTSKIIVNKRISTNTPTYSHPPPLVTNSSLPSSLKPHDIVDLTDDDDHTNRIPIGKDSSTRPNPNSTSTLLSTVTNVRLQQPANLPIRPNNNNVVVSQAFILRSLPEHNPCDYKLAQPQLNIAHDNAAVRLTWNLPGTRMESIQAYEIFAYKQSATTASSDWKKIGSVKSMRLPMVVTLKEFQSNCHYAFAVRAISINNTTGPFCEPKTIYTGVLPAEHLNTSKMLNITL